MRFAYWNLRKSFDSKGLGRGGGAGFGCLSTPILQVLEIILADGRSTLQPSPLHPKSAR